MTTEDVKQNLLLFFDRPTEPCFMNKGSDKAVFQLPDHYFPDRYRSVSSTLSSRFGEGNVRSIPVRDIALPDISVPMELAYNDQFSLFVPHHSKIAGKLIDVFMGMRDLKDLESICSFCQLRVNPYMFNYCLSVALLHRNDTKGMNFPTFFESFPDKFVDPKTFRKARELTSVFPTGPRKPIVIPRNHTASDLEPEQRVAYFREDIGLNLHHWHWHLVYPFDSATPAIVNKDRRGELFYYMHQQVIARYNVERWCNGLSRTKSFSNFREPIVEAYFPKLGSQVASRNWPPRFADSILRDIDRPIDRIRSDVSDLETWRDRFIQAIENMSILLPDGSQLALDETTGIDLLGNIMEASIISRNPSYYGNLHNMGHIFVSYSHDPDFRNLELYGVMGDSATAMRDPFFYRWHAYVDDLFTMFKDKLPPYSKDKLDFPGVEVAFIDVKGPRGNNMFNTQWEQSTIDLERGLDFMLRGSVLAQFTHLQHDEFEYVIKVNNTTGQDVEGTVRIFMAPLQDEAGRALPFNEQRRFMIELDKFSAKLAAGASTLRRSSAESSVTIPYERTFQNQAERRGEPGSAAAAAFDFCGCGWPHHLLVPRGTTQGYPVVLFCMISNWADDRVVQDMIGTCSDAASYCGVRDRKYPDKRAMGYPFDRPAPDVATLCGFLTPNMNVRQCQIRFADETRTRLDSTNSKGVKQ